MSRLGWLLLLGIICNFTFANGQIRDDKKPPDIEDFKADQRAFAAAVYRKVHNMYNDSENIFFSPDSIYQTMGMILAGAKKNTSAQMRRAMRTAFTREVLNEFFGVVYRKKFEGVGSSDMVKTIMASRAFVRGNSTFYLNYTETLKNSYYAEIETVDFGMLEETVERINSWVEQQTESLIKDLVSEDMFSGLTQFVLVNAIYFKASWRYGFTKDKPRYFKTPNGNVSVPYIIRSADYKYSVGNSSITVVIPYADRETEMVIIIPDKEYWKTLVKLPGLEVLFRNLKEKKAGWKRSRLNLRMPVFSVEQSMDVKEVLAKLEVTDLFNQAKADLSDLSKIPIYISHFVHKAKIIVTKEGTEAAAATAAVGVARSLIIGEDVTIDKPFIYAIYQRDTILFMGSVADPSLK